MVRVRRAPRAARSRTLRMPLWPWATSWEIARPRAPRSGRSRCCWEAGGDGQGVHEVVHFMAGMALYPLEGDIAALVHQRHQGFPEFPVGNRLLCRGQPASFEPPCVPRVAEAVDDVRRIRDDQQWAVVRPHRLEGGPDLHPLVRGGGL